MAGDVGGRVAGRPGLRALAGDFGAEYAANGFIGFMFAATGPVAIVISAGTQGGLSAAELASFLFGIFFVNGLITLGMSWAYRQPLCFFWTIPGAVLVGPALQHFSYPQVIGAFYATAALILLLGVSGLVGRAMRVVPMPVVMGMVAGVFLRFGLDLVRALNTDLALTGPMVAVFLALTAAPGLGRRMPPLIGALLVGAAVAVLLGRFDGGATGGLQWTHPLVQAPAWSVGVMVELVVPLAVTVLVVQNGQGFAVLQAAGHAPPVTLCTVMSGLGSACSALVGGVSSCVTGPTNALITASGERERQYTAAMVTGALAVVFALLAPTFLGLLLAAPKAYVMVLAGLAMLRVLQSAFAVSFRGRFSLGALVSFLVTVADLPLLNIGAAFWGLVAGLAVSLLVERRDFSAG